MNSTVATRVILLVGGLRLIAGEAPAATVAELFQESRRIQEAPAVLQKVLTRQREKGFTSEYVEMKHLRLLKRPLRSAGVITLVAGGRVYRRMTDPFRQELLIGERMLQRDEGEAITGVPAGNQPAVKAFVRAFVSLFSGSWTELKQNFDVYFMSAEAGWTIGLRPRDETIRKVIAGVVLEGKAEQLLLLRVDEVRGDRTETRFTKERALTREEEQARDEMLAWKPKRQ